MASRLVAAARSGRRAGRPRRRRPARRAARPGCRAAGAAAARCSAGRARRGSRSGPALGGRFLELSYRAGQFEGRAFYRPAGEGRWRATWFDNRGISFPIEALAAERTLTAEWGSADTERGRTIYRLLPDGRLEVTDMPAAAISPSHILHPRE